VGSAPDLSALLQVDHVLDVVKGFRRKILGGRLTFLGSIFCYREPIPYEKGVWGMMASKQSNVTADCVLGLDDEWFFSKCWSIFPLSFSTVLTSLFSKKSAIECITLVNDNNVIFWWIILRFNEVMITTSKPFFDKKS
jgi:hypothetical protein